MDASGWPAVASPVWWVSVVAVGLGINLASYGLQRGGGRLIRAYSERARRANSKREGEWQEAVAKLEAATPDQLALARLEPVLLCVLGTFGGTVSATAFIGLVLFLPDAIEGSRSLPFLGASMCGALLLWSQILMYAAVRRMLRRLGHLEEAARRGAVERRRV